MNDWQCYFLYLKSVKYTIFSILEHGTDSCLMEKSKTKIRVTSSNPRVASSSAQFLS